MSWRLGVVGYPIEHSLSPQLHRAGLAQLSLAGTSQHVEMPAEQFASLEGLLGARFDALSVTMPLKELATSLCDHRDAAAMRTGMVNSLLVRDGLVHGANTDGEGLLDALRAQFGFAARGARVGVLGAGGAARAVVDALVAHDVAEVALWGRSPDRVAWIAQRYERVVGSCESYDLIINTTPVADRDDEVRDGVSAETIALDITYEPRRSAWMAAHERRGCRSANGLGMLAYQAARQMSWWFDAEVHGAALLEVIT